MRREHQDHHCRHMFPPKVVIVESMFVCCTSKFEFVIVVAKEHGSLGFYAYENFHSDRQDRAKARLHRIVVDVLSVRLATACRDSARYLLLRIFE